MVKADFSYNPYLMQTDVNINGLEPKINSPFEKYRNEKLQSWINKVPKALYDEMNGYDFELNFTGTKADFNDLKSVFLKAGITLSPVQKPNGEIIPATMQLVFKKELENVTVKLKQIRELMTWLNEHPNRKFDYKKFMTDFSWVFNEEIAYITIQDTQTRIVNFPDLNVSVENINTVQALPDDINNTPIVFFVKKATSKAVFNLLNLVKKDPYVVNEQLFFIIEDNLNVHRIERNIIDQGVPTPQIITKMDAPIVWEYLCTYPLTAYVHNVVQLLNITTHKIQTQNINDSRQAEIDNVEIYALLAEIDEKYGLLEERDKQFVNRAELKVPVIFNSALETLENNIKAWNKRKTKYSSDDEAEKNAQKFMEDLDNWFVKFENEIMQAFLDAIEEITLSDSKIYGLEDSTVETDHPYDTFGKNMVNQGDSYCDAAVHEFEETEIDLPNLINDFLLVRQETLVEPSDGLFGLFGRNKNEPKELVPEITYLLSEWREIAYQIVQIKATDLIDIYKNKLREYYNNSGYEYHACLQMELTKLSAQRKENLFKLSDDARLLQTDIDWTSEFIRQVEVIGKG